MKAKAPAVRTIDEDLLDEELPDGDEYERIYVVVRKKSADAEPGESEEQAAGAADEPAAGEVDEPAAEEAPAEEAPPRRLTGIGMRLLTVVTAIALVAVSALLYVVWQQKEDMSADARRQRDLAASARKVADVFFNWDYQHMSQSFAAKYPLLTKAAADAIRPTADTLTSYFTTNKVSSRATVTGVYPGAVKRGAANVMVVINTRVTTGKTVQANSGATVALSMKLVSGKWLAGNITLLSQGVESATDENGKPVSGGTGSSGLPGTVPSARPAH
ncbi:hypothetical protein [Actinomadura opuntiae]|uniref:hypothetical protein n=1 Tax=Actinomadura sp. OS1-43 TaxID=604315 RepID=UPI00255B1C0A|nr:hypothetical protein [Actinomadura sp. OS1-43]MDL4816424.1 hypothetical protein [Actinomadura sp. OS1-43]